MEDVSLLPYLMILKRSPVGVSPAEMVELMAWKDVRTAKSVYEALLTHGLIKRVSMAGHAAHHKFAATTLSEMQTRCTPEGAREVLEALSPLMPGGSTGSSLQGSSELISDGTTEEAAIDLILAEFQNHPKENCRQVSKKDVKEARKRIRDCIQSYGASTVFARVQMYLAYYPHMTSESKTYAPGPLGFFDLDNGNPIKVSATKRNYLTMVCPYSNLGRNIERDAERARAKAKAALMAQVHIEVAEEFKVIWENMTVMVEDPLWSGREERAAQFFIGFLGVTKGVEHDEAYKMFWAGVDAYGAKETMVRAGCWETPKDLEVLYRVQQTMPIEYAKFRRPR